MRWIAPTQKDEANHQLEKRLWAAADQFRANSGLKAGEYSGPVLGLTRCGTLRALADYIRNLTELHTLLGAQERPGEGDGAKSPVSRGEQRHRRDAGGAQERPRPRRGVLADAGQRQSSHSQDME